MTITFNQKWNHFYARQQRGVLDKADRLNILIETGRDAFYMEHGLISRINGGCYTVEYTTNQDWQNLQIPLYQTHCDFTLKINDVLAVHDMKQTIFVTYHAGNPLKIESYIGIPLWVNNSLYGTIAFVASETKTQAFTERDKNFMRSIARGAERILDYN